jgi:AraC-like DNA-binding protein
LPGLTDVFAHNPRTLLHIAPYLRSRSVQPVEIFKRINVSPSKLLDPNGWVPRDLCFQLSDEISKTTGDHFMGAEVGRLFQLADLGPWGLAVSGAATLRQACEAATAGISLIHQGTDLRFQTDGSLAMLSFAYLGRSPIEPRQHILGSLTVLRDVALLAGQPDAVHVQFSHAYQRTEERLEETFGPLLQFGCAQNAIVFDRALLDLPLRHPTVRAASADSVETARSLVAFIKTLLPYGEVSIEHMAALLGMSTRTLQRRLRDWGFSYEEMLDDIRHVEAVRRLSTGCETMKEIAFLLGYSDQAHFTRAFKRWRGVAPRDYARGSSVMSANGT